MVILLVGDGGINRSLQTRESVASASPTRGDFTFNTDGEIKLADFQGKLVLLYFGYTSCPDICPTSLTSMKFAFKALSDEELGKIQGYLR